MSQANCWGDVSVSDGVLGMSNELQAHLLMPKCVSSLSCMSISNVMERAQYGDPGDFDEWARITGDSSWSWDNFKSYLIEHSTDEYLLNSP